MSKLKTIGLYFCLVLTSLAFAAAGLAKLAGVEAVHLSFELMGLPVWFGYFIGLCELVGAIGLWIRKTSVYASIGLFIIMLGAMYFHLSYETFAKTIPAIVLAVLTVLIFTSRKAQANVSV